MEGRADGKTEKASCRVASPLLKKTGAREFHAMKEQIPTGEMIISLQTPRGDDGKMSTLIGKEERKRREKISLKPRWKERKK